MYKARDKNTGKLVALKKTRLEVGERRRAPRPSPPPRGPSCATSPAGGPAHPPNRSMLMLQMEEEGVPSTTLREISLLQMLSESNHIVK